MNKFKDTVGRWFTVGLFKELSGNPNSVVFTVEDAKKMYLDCNDITGYQFSINHLGGWKHWLALKNSPKVRPIVEDWEEELEVRMRSEGIKNIINTSTTDKGYQASKFLADKGWKAKGTGRPSREAIKKEARVQSKMYDEFKGKIIDIKKG